MTATPIANIRRLAAEVKPMPAYSMKYKVFQQLRTRADFWRAVAEWRSAWVDVFTAPNRTASLVELWTEWNEIEQLCALVREREGA